MLFKKKIIAYCKFGFIGVASNLISFSLFTILISFHYKIETSAATGMAAGVINTYTMSRLFLKEKVIRHSISRLILFLSYYTVSILLTSKSIDKITEIYKISHNVSWIFCVFIASIFNFVFVNEVALKNKK
jgi:putative flippase GtrA